MSKPFGDSNWRAMTREQLDAGLNNSTAVAGSADIAAGWGQRSDAMKAKYPAHLDVAYGPRERNRFDFIKAADGGPTLLLIHGGYWQMRSKDFFTCFAAGPIAHGINVAAIGYTLAPEATLDEIVAEMHAGVDALAEKLPSLGGDPNRIVVSGWSAGGHLTSTTLSHPKVKGGVAISGIYDLEPIRASYLNEKLKLDEAMSKRQSPLLQDGGPNKPLALVVGGGELPILRQQTADLAVHRAKYGLPVSYEEIPGADHFSIMKELESPTGRITTLIKELVARI
ncbi:alpha/beta hydrolase [Tardiphaga sp. 42S5]|uniref:alpha/beta hydrolase n=1 Tax=Tardiphaga sp. 42S5 TaxID=1404799 RepID=UPI002A5A9B02|nr:alpha/beta hydrolase [Tardiphaga sp. 42S5]WPO43090.1 alpha/beta hydrolase [Tardiphaga sp. 42S5]